MRFSFVHPIALALVALTVSCSPSQREYRFALQSSGDLKENADITFLGVRVGRITDLQLGHDGQSVVATGSITDPKMRLLKGDTAQVTIGGLLADPHIEIIRSAQSGAELPAGSTVRTWLPKSITLPAEQKKQLETIVETMKAGLKQ